MNAADLNGLCSDVLEGEHWRKMVWDDLQARFAEAVAAERELRSRSPQRFYYVIPSLERCDTIGGRSVIFGFAFLTLAILTGFHWNMSLNGRYWTGDPKEWAALAAWAIPSSPACSSTTSTSSSPAPCPRPEFAVVAGFGRIDPLRASLLRGALDHAGEGLLILPEAAAPLDRIFTATARLNDYTILTADKKILAYPHVKSAW